MTNPKVSELTPEDFIKDVIGLGPAVGEKDVEQILKATGLPLRPHVGEQEIKECLNAISLRLIRNRVNYGDARQKFHDLKDATETLLALSRDLVHSKNPPPLPPPFWVNAVREWIAQTEEYFSQKRVGRPEDLDTQLFYPEALGLFHAAFVSVADTPEPWTNSSEKQAARRFIQKISQNVSDFVAERVRPGHAARDAFLADAKGGFASDDAIRKRINKAICVRMPSEEWEIRPELVHRNATKFRPVIKKAVGVSPPDQPTDLMWSLYARRYRAIILSY